MNSNQIKILKILEKAFGNPLSKEQFNIVSYLHHTNILVNACAGSGKTTTNIFDILFNEACQVISPEHILGITFARKARRAMQTKYKNYRDRFNDLSAKQGLNLKINGTPTFQTFHSVFYHLLSDLYWVKYRQRLPVLLSFYQNYPLTHRIYNCISSKHTQYLTKKKILKIIFETKDMLINLGYTNDGIHPISFHNRTAQESRKYWYNAIHILYAGFADDYINTINEYNQGKQQLGLIDFNDMKTIIANILKRPKNNPDRKYITAKMAPFKYIYIDEFQDIDPIQWDNIKSLLPKEKDRRMTTIGDDDQSIYSFRGSDPHIIINLPKKDHSFKTFNLSTNYRTSRKIVSFIKPEIESNQQRLDKDIRAFHPGGRIIQFRSDRDGSVNAEHALLTKLLTLIHNPKIPNRKICILSRDNLSLEIAVDILANHHVYIKTSHGRIIQSNPLYKSFCGLAEAFVYNNYGVYQKYSTRIGFNYYRRHQKEVRIRTNHDKPFRKLSDYLSSAIAFSKTKSLAKYPQSKHGTEYYSRLDDQKAYQTIASLHTIAKRHPKSLMLAIFNMVRQLVFKHDQFEIKIGLSDKKQQQIILQRVGQNMLSCKKPAQFFKRELIKEQNLKHPQYIRNSINVSTIHAAKGLQFDYVFVYNLDDSLVKYPNLIVENVLGPDCSWRHFIDLCTNDQFVQKAVKSIVNRESPSIFMVILVKLCHQLSKLKRLFPRIYQALRNDEHQSGANHWIFIRFLSSNEFKHYFQTKQNLFNKGQTDDDILKNAFVIYKSMHQVANNVEEERRLIYVAFTRAVKCTYYDLPVKFCPLLTEMNWALQHTTAYDGNNHQFTTHVKPYLKGDIHHV